jgi:hypothetical protein
MQLLSQALIQEMTDAMNAAEEDLLNGASAYDDCEDDDRRKVEVFGAILKDPTVAAVKSHVFAVDWIADLLEDTANRAQHFGRGDRPYDHHAAIVKDYKRITKETP